MSGFKELASAITIATVLFASPDAQAEGLERHQRLSIAGWSMIGVGAVLTGTGMVLAISADCGGSLGCSDDEMFKQNTGFAILAGGLAAGVVIGMPMLIRARALRRDTDSATNGEMTSEGRLQLGLSVGPASLMLRGAF